MFKFYACVLYLIYVYWNEPRFAYKTMFVTFKSNSTGTTNGAGTGYQEFICGWLCGSFCSIFSFL